MSYQVLALKYRPQSFDEVVGQDHVTSTLSNAIASGRVAHAILLTGPRGTGKTTIARILAKTMNCIKGPLPVPCNVCRICTEITRGRCTDVFEIDGASNNSVDQIREIRQNVTYMPSSAKFKIYIIDEVHMLSTAAFNALLKTLEEPPDHVMFIFATTEAHKIPATILSRCQRHDLARIHLPKISDHLKKLCDAEQFSIEGKSLDLIAQEADGSIRDSLSLLDRVLSSSSKKEITYEDVIQGLGIQDKQILHDITEAVFNQNGAKIIELVEQVDNSGIDLKKFYSDIISHFRNFYVTKICGRKTPFVNITESEKEKIALLSQNISDNHLGSILQTLLDGESTVRYTNHTRAAVEMTLLKLIHINPGAQIDSIIKKIDGLAQKIGSMKGNLPDADDISQSDTKSSHAGQPDPVKISSSHDKKDWAENELKADKKGAASPHAVEEPLGESRFNTGSNRTGSEKTWNDFLKDIENQLPFMFALLSKEEGTKKETQSRITVTLKNCSSFDRKRIKDKKQELSSKCLEILGKKLKINIESEAADKPGNGQSRNGYQKRMAAFNHPFVLKAQEIFDGQIIN